MGRKANLGLMMVVVWALYCLWVAVIPVYGQNYFITFDQTPVDFQDSYGDGALYIEGDYYLSTYSDPSHHGSIIRRNPFTQNALVPNNGTIHLAVTHFANPWLQRFDGGIFDLIGLDIAEYSEFANWNRSVTITGCFEDGSTVNTTLPLDRVFDGFGGIKDFQHYSLNWTGLVRLNFDTTGFSMDNIEVVTPPMLEKLELVGPNEVAENFQAQYKAIAHYDNNSTVDVTVLADWSVEPNDIADIEAGLLETEEIDKPQNITITAEYTEGENTQVAEKQVSVLPICPGGYALQFDGQNDYALIPDDEQLRFPSGQLFTIEFWYNSYRAYDRRQTLMEKRTNTSSSGAMYNLRLDQIPNYKLRDSANNVRGGSAAGIYAANQWYHYALVRDTAAGEVRLYIDGQLKSSVDDNTGNITPTRPLALGRSFFHSDPDYFKGAMDELRIWKEALKEEVIAENMHQRLVGNEPNLVGYWNFDEGQGQKTKDLSPYGNDGQLGSTGGVEDSDPEWIESDAPVGICTPVEVDIKPGSCPNPLNLASRGVLPAAILGAEDFDVNTIDAGSIRLEGVPTIRTSYEDVATPVVDGNECECTSQGPDGYTDLTLKFRTQEIVEELVNSGVELVDGQPIMLTLTGALSDGTAVEGVDCIVLVGNVSRWLSAKRWDANTDGVINMADLAQLAEYWLESCEVE